MKNGQIGRAGWLTDISEAFEAADDARGHDLRMIGSKDDAVWVCVWPRKDVNCRLEGPSKGPAAPIEVYFDAPNEGPEEAGSRSR